MNSKSYKALVRKEYGYEPTSKDISPEEYEWLIVRQAIEMYNEKIGHVGSEKAREEIYELTGVHCS